MSGFSPFEELFVRQHHERIYSIEHGQTSLPCGISTCIQKAECSCGYAGSTETVYLELKGQKTLPNGDIVGYVEYGDPPRRSER